MAVKKARGGGVTNANTPAAINAQGDQCTPYLITPWCRANTTARAVAIRLAKLIATARCAEIDATIMVGNIVSGSTYVHRAGRVGTSRLFLSTLAYQRLQILSQWRHLRDRCRHPLQPQILRTNPLLLWRLGQQLRRWLPTANESAQSANTTS